MRKEQIGRRDEEENEWDRDSGREMERVRGGSCPIDNAKGAQNTKINTN